MKRHSRVVQRKKIDQISEAETGDSRSGSTADVAKHCIP